MVSGCAILAACEAPLVTHTGVTEQEAGHAADDARVSDFLNEHGVTEVHVYPFPDAPHAVLIVALLESPTPLSTWPFETASDLCAGAELPADPAIPRSRRLCGPAKPVSWTWVLRPASATSTAMAPSRSPRRDRYCR